MTDFSLEPLADFDTPRQLCWTRFNHNGALLLGGGYDALIRRWRFADDQLEEIAPIEGFQGWVQAFAMHPTEDLLFAADSWGKLACIPLAGDKPTARWSAPQAHGGWIRSLAVTPDGERLASTGNDGFARVFNAETGELLQEFKVSEHDVFAVAIDSDGDSIVTGDLFCRLKRWSLKSGECTGEFDASKMHYYDRDQDVCGLRVLQFADEGKTLIAAGAEPTSAGRGHGVPVVYLFDWESGKLRTRLEQGDANDGFIADFAVHPEGFFLTVCTGQPGKGKLLLQRPEEEQPFLAYTKMSNTHSLAIHDSRLVVAATNRNSQGNGAVKDKEGNYLGNFSPLHLFALNASEAVGAEQNRE